MTTPIIDLAPDISLYNYRLMVQWMAKREIIRMFKEDYALPQPWTDSVTLQKMRFCNVLRKDDKTSKWLVNNWYNDLETVPTKQGFKTALCRVLWGRYINSIPLLQKYPKPTGENNKELAKYMLELKQSSELFIGGAYMINAIGAGCKATRIGEIVEEISEKSDKLLENLTCLELMAETLVKTKHLKMFLAGQITADLVLCFPNVEFVDSLSWAPIGPGSLRQLIRLFPHRKVTRDTLSWFLQHCRETLIEDVLTCFGNFIDNKFNLDLIKLVHKGCSNRESLHDISEDMILTAIRKYHSMQAIDIQNCLCEADKYSRCLSGLQPPKQRYKHNS